jgi:aminoglycoside phosphotransferase
MDWVIRFVSRVLVRFTPQRWLIGLCHYYLQPKQKINEWVQPTARLPGGIIVKWGNVSPGEAATQEYAYRHLDPRIVRVPRVYRFFQDHNDPTWPTGYLFMEYIPGKNLEGLDVDAYREITRRLANIVRYIQEVPREIDSPGPVGGGVPRGNMWGYHDAGTTFSSVDDLNAWVNRRIEVLNKTVDLRQYPLVLCHLDLCRRNTLMMEDGSICLLDWGYAGFFPRFYEVAAIEFYNDAYS